MDKLWSMKEKLCSYQFLCDQVNFEFFLIFIPHVICYSPTFSVHVCGNTLHFLFWWSFHYTSLHIKGTVHLKTQVKFMFLWHPQFWSNCKVQNVKITKLKFKSLFCCFSPLLLQLFIHNENVTKLAPLLLWSSRNELVLFFFWLSFSFKCPFYTGEIVRKFNND